MAVLVLAFLDPPIVPPSRWLGEQGCYYHSVYLSPGTLLPQHYSSYLPSLAVLCFDCCRKY